MWRKTGNGTLRLPSCVNCFPQWSSLQVKGLTCWWTILWARTLPLWANDLPQMSQL